MNFQCNKIDDYVDGELDDSSQAEFVEHLGTCDLCQMEIEIESNLDDKVATAWQSVNAPVSLRGCLQSEPQFKPEPECDSMLAGASKPFYRSAVAACIAVAAVIFLILSAALSRSPKNEGRELTGVQMDDGNTHKITTEPMQPLATVIQNKDSNAIFVPQTSSASYTIVKVYPTISNNSKLTETFTGENQ